MPGRSPKIARAPAVKKLEEIKQDGFLGRKETIQPGVVWELSEWMKRIAYFYLEGVVLDLDNGKDKKYRQEWFCAPGFLGSCM